MGDMWNQVSNLCYLYLNRRLLGCVRLFNCFELLHSVIETKEPIEIIILMEILMIISKEQVNSPQELMEPYGPPEACFRFVMDAYVCMVWNILLKNLSFTVLI